MLNRESHTFIFILYKNGTDSAPIVSLWDSQIFNKVYQRITHFFILLRLLIIPEVQTTKCPIGNGLRMKSDINCR